MATVKRPKCRSRVIPCPAGDRCPEHRGMMLAIREAASKGDYAKVLDLKAEEATKEQRARQQEFLSQTRVKKNRKGELVVTLPPVKEEIFSATNGNVDFKLTHIKSQKVVVSKHPADLVDKDKPITATEQTIFHAGVVRKNPHEAFKEAVSETYDGNVSIDFKHGFDSYVINKIDVADDYKNHGVEEHVIASFVLSQRTDLYDFFATDEVPYESLVATGFEPNPYYWAGKTHPQTGVTYPEEKVLNALNSYETNPNSMSYHGMYAARHSSEHPYMRLKHGKRLNDLPMEIVPEFTKKQRRHYDELQGAREETLLKARSYPRSTKIA